MKVIAKEDLITHLTKQKGYKVISECADFYVIVNDIGEKDNYSKWRFEVVEESIFKKGDKVYNHHYGWLTIDGNNGNFYYFVDDNEKRISIRPIDLSFTEYTITGFSQEPPLELPEVGEVCLFSDDEIKWFIKEFE